LTTARYFTPSGHSIQAKGIVPDVQVEDTSTPEFKLREADLDKHLANPEDVAKAIAEKSSEATNAGKTAPKPGAKDEEKSSEDSKNFQPLEFASDKDFVFQQGLNYLKGQPVLARAKVQSAQANTDAAAPAKN